MNIVSAIGILAGICTTISFVPQALKVYKTKDTKSLSLGMFLIFLLGISLWLTYGIILHNTPITIANSITMPMAIYIIIMKIKHG